MESPNASARLCSLSLAFGLVLAAASAKAQTNPNNKTTNKPAATNPTQSQKTPLSEEENPEMIGKRNINKHQVNFYNLEKEVAIGRQFAREVDQSAKLVEDPIVVEYINKVGQNLVLHSDAKVPFTIKVIDSDEVNAFALPGGFFYVNKGLILEADNEAELAGPMAHEIAHVCARHGVEQASKGQLVNWGTLPLIFMGGWGGFGARQAASLLIPMGFLQFSRNAENEADRLGAQYMWACGYDPHALASFFEKLQTKDKKKPGTLARIFSTHPMTADRIANVNALIARFPDRNEYTLNTSEFNQVKGRLISITNAKVAGRGGSDAAAENKRPTLKRRQPGQPEGTDTGASGGAEDSKAPADRPTLKRGEPKPDKPNDKPTGN
ncbi:MAG: M48 family metalloprotease [Acidobacteria bacterium]|nr:M48 family metalloprotease [Acidobacteriota bacterium]MBI3428252.1 M48 family metalloprotease [Acidobacteriota bacterium]